MLKTLLQCKSVKDENVCRLGWGIVHGTRLFLPSVILLSLQSAIIGDNHPGDDSPRDNLPTESTPGGNPPPRLGVLIQTDPRRGFPNPSRPTGRGIICKLTLTRISDPNQPTTWGPDPNPNRPTGRELSEN